MKYTLLFLTIFLVAAFLRFWHLGGIPISPNWDEAALGYNAYSILQTGKDEYGTPFPLILRSFNNYTPALYAYLAIPAIAIFDLSVFSVRIPSAFMGTLAVIGTFFLSRELFSLLAIQGKRRTFLSLLVMTLMAISPWHIQFSRVAYEASIGFTCVIWGFVFFLLGLRKPVFFIASAIAYGLSMNAYHSPRLFVPLLILGLTVIFKDTIVRLKKHLIMPILIGVVFLLPFLYFFTQGENNQVIARFSATSIFTQQSSEEKAIADFSLLGTSFEKSLYTVATGYLTHFSPVWLFVTGDNDRHHAPSMGLLYLWELPFLLIGIVRLLLSRGTFKRVMLLWLLLVPIPASLTSEVPHAVRTLLFLPSLQILTVLGIEKSYRVLISHMSLKMQVLTVILGVSIVIFSFLNYAHLYFFQLNHEFSRVWQFGFEHAVNHAQGQRGKYTKMVVSNKLEQPYIFFLFYTRFDPTMYLAKGGTKDGAVQSFDIFEFREITWSKEVHDGSTLYFLSPIEEHGNPLHTIRYFDSSVAIAISE